MGDINELLRKSWEGEILGRAFFSALVDLRPADERMWQLMAVLESTMEGLVEPVGAAHGVQVDVAALSDSAVDFARNTKGEPRDELLKTTLAIAVRGLPVYEELRPLLSEDEAWLADELVEHEQAFAHYVKAELAGTPGGEAPLVEFITRHGAGVPQ